MSSRYHILFTARGRSERQPHLEQSREPESRAEDMCL